MARRRKPKNPRKPDLRRTGKLREPKQRFILFCEGKNTEPEYFKALRRVYSSTLIDVKVVPGPGVPMTITERAIKRAESEGLGMKRRRKKHLYEQNDEIWAIFDRDEHPNYQDAIN